MSFNVDTFFFLFRFNFEEFFFDNRDMVQFGATLSSDNLNEIKDRLMKPQIEASPDVFAWTHR